MVRFGELSTVHQYCKLGEGNNVQAWIVEVVFTHPLIGSVAARVGMSLVLAMLMIVALLIMSVAVRVGVVAHRDKYWICRLGNERCSGS